MGLDFDPCSLDFCSLATFRSTQLLVRSSDFNVVCVIGFLTPCSSYLRHSWVLRHFLDHWIFPQRKLAKHGAGLRPLHPQQSLPPDSCEEEIHCMSSSSHAHELRTKLVLLSSHHLSSHICQIFTCANFLDTHLPLFKHFLDPMIPDYYMLGLRMVRGVLA